MNYKTLRYMVRNGIVRGCDFNTESIEDCETCIQAKRPREMIGSNQSNRAEKILDLIHVDQLNQYH